MVWDEWHHRPFKNLMNEIAWEPTLKTKENIIPVTLKKSEIVFLSYLKTEIAKGKGKVTARLMVNSCLQE